jgi:hypothetical protein
MICLFSWSGPPAVAWAIIIVVIYAIKAVSRRALSHVGKKVLKRMPPSLTDSYTPSPVIWESYVFFVITPVAHVYPRPVRACPGTPVRRVVVPVVAAAAHSQPACEGSLLDGRDCSAVAPALPRPMRVAVSAGLRFCFIQNEQTPKPLAAEVNVLSGHTRHPFYEIIRDGRIVVLNSQGKKTQVGQNHVYLRVGLGAVSYLEAQMKSKCKCAKATIEAIERAVKGQEEKDLGKDDREEETITVRQKRIHTAWMRRMVELYRQVEAQNAELRKTTRS